MTEEPRSGAHLVIDGRPLSFPGTGLAVVAAEVAAELGRSLGRVTLLVDRDRRAEGLGHEVREVRQLEVASRAPAWRFMGRVLGVPDHFEREVWGRRAGAAIRALAPEHRLFVPYFFNFGLRSRSSVLIPDFIFRDSNRAALVAKYKWLAWRHRLPVRRWFQDRETRRVRQARQLLVYSKHVGSQARDHLGPDADRVEVVTLGCPSWVVREYDPANDAIASSRFSLPSRFVLYAGGFAERKNVPLLLSACGRAWQSDPTFRCVVVGLSHERASAVADPGLLRRLAEESVERSTVSLPHCSYRDLASLLRLAAFVVYPSREEGFGLPVLEAAAAGKICLCSNASSLREVQPESDLRVPAGDVDAWVQAMVGLWRETDLAGLSERAAKVVVERHSWRPLTEKLLTFLNEEA